MPVNPINSIRFNTRCTGKGPAFIWGHGLMASMRSEDLVDLFEWDKFPETNRLIRYDAKGHGETQPTFFSEDYHWKQLAKDMLAVAESYGETSVIAGGQSMGCATAIYSACIAPEKIKGLILVNPPTAWETRAEQGKLYHKMATMGWLFGGGMLARMMRNKLSRLLPQWLIDAKEGKVEGALEGLKPLKRKTLYNLFKGAALTDFPSRETIENIQVPCLVLGWIGDPTHPVETAEELHRLLPDSELVIANGYSDFKKWPELMRNFLQNQRQIKPALDSAS